MQSYLCRASQRMQISSWSGHDAPVSVTVHNDERATGFAEA